MLTIGQQFDRFQIRSHIARGGMADIYRAYDMVQQREVALKIPDRTIMGDPALYERFQREMEVNRTLDHPFVLRGLGCGQFNRTPYLAAELVEGRMLRDIITESAPMPADQVIALIRQVAEGLAYCHAQGVLHRDLKPENILVTPQGKPVIMDFGLALTKGSHRVTYGSIGEILGTPDYMAPEQVKGQRGDARTDIYALGLVMYEMLFGHLPSETQDNGLPPASSGSGGTTPQQLTAIAFRCVQADPEDRYQSMDELITALDYPEKADLSLSYLKHNVPATGYVDPTLGMVLKGIVIAILLLLGFTAIGLILQALHP